jgi:hypothetical protein
VIFVAALFCQASTLGSDLSQAVEGALARAGDNKPQIQQALADAPAEQQEAMRFLVAHMPQRDLKELKAEFLLENLRVTYRGWEEAPWKNAVPKEIFLNNVLPYASINERRDNWRADFYEKFKPLVKDAKTPAAAAAILNQKIYAMLKVKYSTKRPKADQSPHESIESGLASCTGLAVLLIDACRAVGVPARFVGTPLWADGSGNHSWVEIWDDGWHFTGAAEPSGDKLDQAWFIGRASAAKRDHPLHGIYAVSFQRTPQIFPMVWDRKNKSVFAVNVTDRYTRLAEKLSEGVVRVMFRVLERPGGERVAAKIEVADAEGKLVFGGTINDERFDANDHRTVPLAVGQKAKLKLRFRNRVLTTTIEPKKADELFTFALTEFSPAKDGIDSDASRSAVEALEKHLRLDASKRTALSEQGFAGVPLTRDDAETAQRLLWEEHMRRIRESRAEEMKERKLREGELEMPFDYKVFGEKPKTGRSLFISLHGGGGAPKAVNDKQWENQKRLYRPAEGVYLAPRAPTNTWNLWHQAHIDKLFDRLIENLIVFEDVDPNRVYVLGYSAGGDGVYQLAPRMADRFAAAAMMAGHPNESSPLGLRNLPFTLHVGGKDAAYNRNKVAAEWEKKLAELRKADPDGYIHWAKIYPDKAHWLDREDAAALPWMAKFDRNPLPRRIVWRQDDVTHSRFYWLAVAGENQKAGTEVVATLDKQRFDIAARGVNRLTVRLNDLMLDLDEPVTVSANGNVPVTKPVQRTIRNMAMTLAERGDPRSMFSGVLTVELGPAK